MEHNFLRLLSDKNKSKAGSNVKAESKLTPRFPTEDLAKVARGPRVSLL